MQRTWSPAASRGLVPYLVVVHVLGLASFAVALAGPFVGPDGQSAVPALTYVCLAVAVVVGELRPIVVPRGDSTDEITVSTTLALVLALLGPLWLAVLAQMVGVALEDLRVRKDLVKVTFNIAQYTLTLLLARAAYCLLSGEPLLGASTLELPADLPAAVLAGLTYFAVNNGLAGTVSALASGQRVLPHLRADVRFQVATSGVLLAFAPVLVAALQTTLWLLPLSLLPLLAVYLSAQLAADREHEALHDALTGLATAPCCRLRAHPPSRAAAPGTPCCSSTSTASRRSTTPSATTVGDDLLREVGRAGSPPACARATWSCRLGGDEFAVLALRDEDARRAAGRRPRARPPSRTPSSSTAPGSTSTPASASRCTPSTAATRRLLQRADVALYAAKAERGDGAPVRPGHDVHSRERLALATELRDALAQRALFCVYQPKVDAATGAVVGVEALVRWRLPDGGVLMPDDFLGVAENTGLVRPLTLQVLETALADQAVWREQGLPLELAVNISVRHLHDLELPGQVPGCWPTTAPSRRRSCSRSPRRRSCRTRSAPWPCSTTCVRSGSGWPSTTSAPATRRSRTCTGWTSTSSRSTSRSSWGSARAAATRASSGRRSSWGTAWACGWWPRGSRTRPRWRWCRAWGCDQVQGYLLSRPMPADDVTGWLLARSA